MSGRDDRMTPMELLERMFQVELDFLNSDKTDIQPLARAFHTDVVVHEPASMPYSGEWKGLAGVASLLREMSEVWNDIAVEHLTAAQSGDLIFLTCTLQLTSRATGAVIRQPFAEVLRFKDGRLFDGTPFYFDTAEIVRAIR